MTMKTLSWAMNQHLPPVHKLLLIWLTECADQEGNVDKSDADLAMFCGVSPDKIRHVLPDLEYCGFIHRRKSSNLPIRTIITITGADE